MKVKVIVHEAEEGGYWGEIPALPGCVSQGETLDELMNNLHEAIEGYLSVDIAPSAGTGSERVVELALSGRSPASSSSGFLSVMVGRYFVSTVATISTARRATRPVSPFLSMATRI